MSNYAKILSLSYNAANATITSARKTYYRSVRLIKDDTTVNPGRYSKYTNVLLCGNCIDPEERNLYVFYIDTSIIKSAWIIEINIDSRVQTVVYYDKYNAIGFSPLHKIYNARVVHGRIVWTDDYNPIYQMDIKRAKKSFYPGFNIAPGTGIGYGENAVITEWHKLTPYATNRIVTSGNNFYQALSYHSGIEPKGVTGSTAWRKLCLIEDAYYSMDVKNFLFEPVPPKLPPVVGYESDSTRKINNLRQTLFQIAYRYVYMDWRRSTFSPASLVPVPQAEEETATGLASENTSLNNSLKITVDSGGEEVRAIEVVGRSSDDPSKWFLIETIDKFKEEERGEEESGISEPSVLTLTLTVLDPVASDPITGELTVTPSATFAYDMSPCELAGFVHVESNGIWTCSLNYGSNFSLDVNGGIGDGFIQITCVANNSTQNDFTDTLNLYMDGVLMDSCYITQYGNNGTCNQ